MFTELPPDFPEDKMRELVEALADKARKIGLYVTGVALNLDTEDADCDDPTHDHGKAHALIMQFTIGDAAFSKRVQDPESDEFDLQFKKIESGSIVDQMDDIRSKYNQKKEDNGRDAGSDGP